MKLAAKLNRAAQNCLKAIAGSEILHKIFFNFFYYQTKIGTIL
jgi:hypothetical protein